MDRRVVNAPDRRRISKLFNQIDEHVKLIAQGDFKCKRKIVVCAISGAMEHGVIYTYFGVNGPQPSHVCKNIVGGCGCAHAEPKAILSVLRAPKRSIQWDLVSLYSPCSWCANFIIDSEVVYRCFYKILSEHDSTGVDLLKANLKGGCFSFEEFENDRIRGE